MTEVTSSSFNELFPLIIQAIDNSCFLAIDTEFSSIEPFRSHIKTIKELYEQRSNFVKEITVHQFGLAIFSKTSEQHRYHVHIYNFYLKPTAFEPIDVKYSVKSSSIQFLCDFKFDFNKCFYSGTSFLNQTQEQTLRSQITSLSNYQFSMHEKNFFNVLFESINQWLITARVGDIMEYELTNKNKEIHNDYLIHIEIRRCFKTIWTYTKMIDDRKVLFIEHITKETYDQRIKDNVHTNQDSELFIQSLIGFTKLIRYLRDNYRKPIVGHNCFLDWLLIYDKFLDNLPSKFEQYQLSMSRTFLSPLFDTKYLAVELKEHWFTRQTRSNKSNCINNTTAATSLSSLFDLLTSRFYDTLIFFKPIIELSSTHRYKNENFEHEAGYDAYMSGIIFLKLIYLNTQKKFNKLEFNQCEFIVDQCFSDIQQYKNRFYSTCTPYLSLNRSDMQKNLQMKSRYCLVIKKHNQETIDLSDITSTFNSYCSMEYEVNRYSNEIYLFFQSEHCQRLILRDHANHPLYRIEKFNWFKHSIFVKYSLGISIVMTGICVFFLVKKRRL